MADVEVNPAQLATTADFLMESAEDIASILQLLNTAAATLSTQWTGEAQAAYLAAHKQMTVSGQEIALMLHAISLVVDALAITYSDTDLAGQRALGNA